MEHDRAIDHDGRHDITKAVSDLTDRVVAKRVLMQEGLSVVADNNSQGTAIVAAANRQPRVQVLPPIQIKGLAADVMTVKRGFADIRETVRDVNMVAAALNQDLVTVRDQLHAHREDIRFEAEALGNGGDNSGDTDIKTDK